MEKSIREAFDLKPASLKSLPTLSLAYVGDAVYELIVRTVLIERSGGKNGALHRKAISYVSARSQALMAEYLKPFLTEEEEAVFRRGKNAKPEHGAKNADEREYHLATGLEALIGYLYLDSRKERAIELIKMGFEHAGD